MKNIKKNELKNFKHGLDAMTPGSTQLQIWEVTKINKSSKKIILKGYT
jgi:hypothetical protein